MFEFSIARKYLIPRKKQLSVSLIALLSVVVISLVVWLLLVFLSVMDGIEKRWLDKLTALHAPLRINPTHAYYSSYYYLIDEKSEASRYAHKSIGEKLQSETSDPYDAEVDQELPRHFPRHDAIDPVKSAFGILESMKSKKGLSFQDYEMSGGLLRLELVRQDERVLGEQTRSFLTQVSYFASLPTKNPFLKDLILAPSRDAPDHHEGTGTYPTKIPYEISGDFETDFLNFSEGSIGETTAEEKFRKYGQNGRNIDGNFSWIGSGLLLPKSFQESGVLAGDQGHVSYTTTTLGAVQEQRIPVHVAGFYDPGIMAVGNRCILAPTPLVRTIHASQGAYTLDPTLSNGIQVWFSDRAKAAEIKRELGRAFQEAGIGKYWKISTYREYDFAKDLLEQFQSDKYLFSLIGAIILVVACCNIISLLVLLVNDKKKEIGILQSMGASGKSIAAIFALCGAALGTLGCLIGTAAAFLTLKNIDALVELLSFLQGHEAFNAVFYGKTLPHELSGEALLFVLIATPLISLLAGLVPAFKASRLKPAEILRAEA